MSSRAEQRVEPTNGWALPKNCSFLKESQKSHKYFMASLPEILIFEIEISVRDIYFVF